MGWEHFDATAPWWRKKNTAVIFAAMVVATLALASTCSRPSPTWQAGYMVNAEPRQSPIKGPSWQVGQITIEPLASYEIEARVLGRRDYSSDPESAISPMDLALGWGPMSDDAVLGQLRLRQSGRWYHYSWQGRTPPIPAAQIVQNSANTHLVPANEQVARAMDKIVAGDRVLLTGMLISAVAPNGWRWKSSMRRTDTGNGACELMWVEKVQILPPPDR